MTQPTNDPRLTLRARIGIVWRSLPHPIRWVVAATVGGTLVVLGLLFMVLPGPGIPLVIAGLALLATEFAWAAAIYEKAKHHGESFMKVLAAKFRRSGIHLP